MEVVLYFRSTKRRPPAAQRPAMDAFVKRNDLAIADRFTERSNAKGYPALREAIEAARGRTLVLSNLGRLDRSPEFTALLRHADDFVALDNPDFNSNTIHIHAAMAEQQAAILSRKAKDRISVLKKAGVKFGTAAKTQNGRNNFRGKTKGAKISAKLRTQRAKDYYAFVMPRIVAWRREGLGYWAIADTLNEEGQVTQAGKPYTDVAVLRLVRRYEQETGEKLPNPGPGRPRC